LVTGADRLDVPAQQQALVDVASRLTSYPWTVDAATVRPLRGVAGLDDAAAFTVVALVALFNHLTRVADATGIEADYGGTLPTFRRRAGADGAPVRGVRRAARAAGTSEAAWREPLRAVLPDVADRWTELHDYVLGRDAPLERDVRLRLALVAAEAAGDDAWTAELAGSAEVPVERTVLRYAEKLASRPWEMTEHDLDELRGLGYDDVAALDVIGVVAFAAAHARLRIGVAALLAG
jgi:alkylhydroperoxidase family enzyme